MGLKKTKLVSIVNVTGIATVGIYTAGLTATAAGVGSTSFIRSVIMHNTGLGTAILGMSTKFFTCTLALMYRGKDDLGEVQGGVMYYIEEGLGKKFK